MSEFKEHQYKSEIKSLKAKNTIKQKKIDELEKKLEKAVKCLEYYADCNNYIFTERGCISGVKYYVLKDSRPFEAEKTYEKITGKPFNQNPERD